MTRQRDHTRQPHRTPRAEAAQQARAVRLAEEMRRNLLKRKHQQRGQRERAGEPDPGRSTRPEPGGEPGAT